MKHASALGAMAANTAPEDPDDDADDLRPSKTQRKQEMTALQQLGEALLGLTATQLEKIDLPDNLRDALKHTAKVRGHEGRRRHMQYIGKLMRQVDAEPIRKALDDATGASRAAVALMHKSEKWRDRLLDDDEALTAFLADHPAVDAQPLRALIRAARRERDKNLPPRQIRELYRFLHTALQDETTSP